MTFAHVVNMMPMEDAGQSVAMESIVEAAQHAARHGIKVDLYTVEVAGQKQPPRKKEFKPLNSIQRTQHDLEGFHEKAEQHQVFLKAPHIPLLSDILEALYNGSDADWFVFANADTGVTREFYTRLVHFMAMKAGQTSALLIHKKIVPMELAIEVANGRRTIDELFREVNRSKKGHPALEYRVWRREYTPIIREYIGNVFLGYAPVSNIFSHAVSCIVPEKSLLEIPSNIGLAFHAGGDGEHTKHHLKNPIDLFNIGIARNAADSFMQNHPTICPECAGVTTLKTLCSLRKISPIPRGFLKA